MPRVHWLIVWLSQEAKCTAKGFQLWEVLKLFIIIIINEIFIQDVHFSVTYIAFNMYPVKINDYKLINKIKMTS